MGIFDSGGHRLPIYHPLTRKLCSTADDFTQSERWYLNGCVKIEESIISPTDKQAQACLCVCQMLSNTYRDLHLFRFDPPTGDVYILAGKDLEVIVPPSGVWRFP